MPELPEVETVRRALQRVLVGRRIEDVQVHERRLRYLVRSRTLRRLVVGRCVDEVRRRAKYLLVSLQGESCLLVHLGMSGRLLLEPRQAPRQNHVHVVFRLDRGEELRFCDPRRFGFVEALTSEALSRDRRLVNLGVEPLSREFGAAAFYERSRGLRKPVKNFLMDARELVGVGNIYASEALFLAGIHPRRAAGRVGLERWELLVSSVQKVLREAIARGGTTIRDFRAANGSFGSFQQQLRVYDRAGEACRHCRTAVRRVVLAGRSTYYCPKCQR